MIGMAKSSSNIDIVGLIERTITSINAPEIVTVGDSAFKNCVNLEQCALDNATKIGPYAFYHTAIKRAYFPSCSQLKEYSFQYCTSLQTAVFPKYDDLKGGNARIFSNCTKLISADLNRAVLLTNVFNGCSVFNLLILRRGDNITALNSLNNFDGTPFTNGKTGGTIYIPKLLYDHLGDGSSLDYKAAANWSTINGYGTITWAQIEGSYYETHYVDGTPI